MSVEYNKLNAQAKKVLLNKHTERAWTGKYLHNKSKGTYICRRCNAPLYESSSKFESNCGWPSFDQELKGAVRREIDADGVRIEILCENCGGHLGHVFFGEGFTAKNTRHCVNSISMDFIAANKPLPEVIRPKLDSRREPAKSADKGADKGAANGAGTENGASNEPANGKPDKENQETQEAGNAGDGEGGTLESSKEDKAAKSSSKTPKGDDGSGKG
jgi:methionine-R-sulfoxide reductase